MIDLQDKRCCPTLDEISGCTRNPVFDRFCRQLETDLGAEYQITFSSCSWMPGWNVKYRKAGKGLCTIYPREGFFTVLVVVGSKEKEAAEAILPECTRTLREIYAQTQEGNGQRWLMIDLEDGDGLYEDVQKFIRIRRFSKK